MPNRARVWCLSFPGKGGHRTPSSGLAQPPHTRPASLLASPPGPRGDAFGAAIGVGVAVCRYDQAVIRAAVGDFLAALGARAAGRQAAGGNPFAIAVSMPGSAWAGRL